MEKKKWDFAYDEEVFDDWGNNIAGLITNGEDYLFYHVYPHEKGGKEYLHIYNSIWMSDDTEECCYLWTAENDEILINALNEAKSIVDITGDDGLLHQIEFSQKEDDDYIDVPERYPDELYLQAESNRAETEYFNR